MFGQIPHEKSTCHKLLAEPALILSRFRPYPEVRTFIRSAALVKKGSPDTFAAWCMNVRYGRQI